MIEFKSHILENGLTVIIHEDPNTPLAVVNTLYKVGSRDENPNKTGFAHLFEHLMFGGSKNVADFDGELQRVGGDNNAFTSTDITNYYITLPHQNIETAFWLESDRMLELSFSQKVLDTQRKVVVEEFKQRYLNQPYGDVWLKLRPLAYHIHPYQWPTIGKEISHIEGATMEDVKNFFYGFYAPNNAILVVAGNVKESMILDLVNKWFGGIHGRKLNTHDLPVEPMQSDYRIEKIQSEVPVDALYMVFHVAGRHEKKYYIADLMSDILGRGHSCRLYEKLVKKNSIFNSLSASMTGSFDPGLMVINGKLNPGQNIMDAEDLVWELIEDFSNTQIEDFEIEKVKHQAESTLLYNETDILHRAMNLAISTALGDTNLINSEIDLIQSVTKENITDMAKNILRRENCSTLHYLSKE